MAGFHIPLGRFLDTQPVSIIDIGSNTIRLIVYEGARRSPAIIFNEKVQCGLGTNLSSQGRLSDESMERAYAALARFRTISYQLGSDTINAIATAAARDASNGSIFVANAEKVLSSKINLLTGQEEAHLAALGVVSGIHDADGLVADMGGGSLEITNVRKLKLKEAVSLPLGALRIKESSEGNNEKALKFVNSHLSGHKWLKKGQDRPLYLVGGTWRALAKLHINRQKYPLKFVHEYSVDVSSILNLIQSIEQTSIQDLEQIEEIPKARRATFIYGALALKGLLEHINPSKVVFSNYGVRDGLLYTLLPKEEKDKQPLYSACHDLSVLRSRSPKNSEEMCSWTDKLFRTLNISETDSENRFRHAACLLSDIAWRTYPEYRGLHSLNIIAQGSFAGVDHFGRAFIALAVYFRHKGRVKTGKLPDISTILDNKAIERARIIGFSIRLANIISTGIPGILPNTPIEQKGGKLILSLPKSYADLQGERLLRRLTNLAQLVKCEPELAIVE